MTSKATSIPASDLWKEDTAYSFNNTGLLPSGDPANGKVYLSKDGQKGWDNNIVPFGSALEDLKDIIVQKGSYEQVMETSSIIITIIMKDGTSKKTMALFTGSQNETGFVKKTFLRFTSDVGTFLLGPKSAGSTAYMTPADYEMDFPKVVYGY